MMQTEVWSLLLCSILDVHAWDNLFVIKQWFQLCNAVFLLLQRQNLAVAFSALWFICYRFVWWRTLSSQRYSDFLCNSWRASKACFPLKLSCCDTVFQWLRTRQLETTKKRQFNLEIRSIKVTCTIIFNMFHFFMPSSHKISFNIIQNKWNGHIRGALSNGSYQISPLCMSKSHVLYQILDSSSRFIINDINTSVLKRDIYITFMHQDCWVHDAFTFHTQKHTDM